MGKRNSQSRPQAKHTGGSWTLAPNDVWNIPDVPISEVHFEIRHTRFPFASVQGVTGLAMDGDGYVYGIRALTHCRESGYQIEGQVSIDGRKVRAFTSDALFQRADGSLVSVAKLYVCMGDVPIPIPNLVTAPDEVLKELASKYHYNRDNSRALICEYCQLSLSIRDGWSAQHPHCEYPKRLEETYQALPAWARFREVSNGL